MVAPRPSEKTVPVHWHKQSHVLVVEIDNPPVNALGAQVRKGLLRAVEAAEADAEIQALLLTGAGRCFIAGADIREFGQTPRSPSLPEVCARLEACNKPVVAALHGVALGGGLEVAMAAHYRIAAVGTRLGMPEVNLGLLPGAGGTQRLPRLVGVPAALDMILSGKPINTEKAARLGLVDRAVPADALQQKATAYANELAVSHTARRTSEQTRQLQDADAARQALAAAHKQLDGKYRGLYSPARIIEAVEATLTVPFADGMKLERQTFTACLETPQRQALVHAFFSEREVAKVPEAGRAAPRALHAIGVVGGGTMGSGIAVALLDAGLSVTLIERDEASLEQGRSRIAGMLDHAVDRGRISAATRDQRLARLATSTDYPSLAEADLVIEAVFEDLAVKTAVFKELDRVCKPGAVLASNTSYLDPNKLAAMTARPADVIGLHFFSPAHIMKLLEVVITDSVADDVVATAFALARRLKKIAVRAGVCDGFIGNRILSAYRKAAEYLLEDGASPYQIDRAMVDFGFAMGPFQVTDLAGGDIAWASRKRRAPTRDPRERYVQVADRLCEKGWFGQKTGRGWYRYEAGSRKGREDPEVLAIVAEERANAGITPRSFSDQAIRDHCLAAMANEGARCVQEGIALRPLDVDVVLINGYGFPRYRGGPLCHADAVGPTRILDDIRRFAEHDAFFWQPATLLVELAEHGRSFSELNK